jgi:ribosomal protein S18 acetylase RimI-like enzyme
MDLRPATAADAPALAALAIAFRDHLARTFPSDAQLAQGVAQLLAAPDAELVVACEGIALRGYALLRFRHSMWAAGIEAALEDLFVDPSARRGGVGRRLVTFALERARARGAVTACLDTNEHNTASTRIYGSLGFDCVSRRWNGRQLFYRVSLTP